MIFPVTLSISFHIQVCVCNSHKNILNMTLWPLVKTVHKLICNLQSETFLWRHGKRCGEKKNIYIYFPLWFPGQRFSPSKHCTLGKLIQSLNPEMLFLCISPAWEWNYNPVVIWRSLSALWGFVMKMTETNFSLFFNRDSLGACVRGCTILFHDSLICCTRLTYSALLYVYLCVLYVYNTKVMPWFFMIAFPVCVKMRQYRACGDIRGHTCLLVWSIHVKWRTKGQFFLCPQEIEENRGQNRGGILHIPISGHDL